MAVVVGDLGSAGVVLEVDPDLRAGWPQPDEVADDLGVGQAGFETDAAVEDGPASGGIGVAVPFAGYRLAGLL